MSGEMANLGGDLPVNPQENTGVQRFVDTNVVPYDPAKVPARQDEINGIMERYSDPVDVDQRVAELQLKLAEWDDEVGISYTFISGHHLPGLEFHGRAHKLAFSGNFVPGANFEGADLYGSLWTATQAPGINLARANMDQSIAPLASMPGADMRRMRGHDLVLNFADLEGAKTRGAELAGSYLIATRGLTRELLEQAANIRGSRLLIDADKIEANPGMATAARFETSVHDPFLGEVSPAKIYIGQDIPKRMLSGGNMPGAVFLDLVMTEARVTGTEYEGSIWSDVVAHRAGIRAARLGGAVIDNSDFSHTDTGMLWAPGMAMFDSKMRGVELSGNLPGLILVGNDFEESAIDPNANVDGTLIIGGRPPEMAATSTARVLTPADIPATVMEALLRHAARRTNAPALGSSAQVELETGDSA